jgi:hypothetical protein
VTEATDGGQLEQRGRTGLAAWTRVSPFVAAAYRPFAEAASGHHGPFGSFPALCGKIRDRLGHAKEILEGSKISRIQR